MLVCYVCGCDRRMLCTRCREGRCSSWRGGLAVATPRDAAMRKRSASPAPPRPLRRTAVSLILAVSAVLTGCATARHSEASSTEQLLATAGFRMQRPDSPERQRRLEAMSPYRLVRHTVEGTIVYTYADPEQCRCVYVGGPAEYATYRRLVKEREIAGEEAGAHAADREADMAWPLW